MRTIYKYALSLYPGTIQMPVGATVLCIQEQYGTPVLWALVHEDVIALEERKFICCLTGGAVPAGAKYVGTFQLQLDGGAFVGHVFEVA